MGANLQRGAGTQGYLAHKKLHTPRTVQQDYAWGPMAALGGRAVSYQRGTPVRETPPKLIAVQEDGPARFTLRVVHLGRSTCHAISGQRD